MGWSQQALSMHAVRSGRRRTAMEYDIHFARTSLTWYWNLSRLMSSNLRRSGTTQIDLSGCWNTFIAQNFLVADPPHTRRYSTSSRMHEKHPFSTLAYLAILVCQLLASNHRGCRYRRDGSLEMARCAPVACAADKRPYRPPMMHIA